MIQSKHPPEPKTLEANGIILLGGKRAKQFGFTSDLFDGYLWKTGNRIIVSLIFSLQEGKGNVRQLFDRIESLGYSVAVPSPSYRMRTICMKRGMTEHWEDGYEIMRKPEKKHP